MSLLDFPGGITRNIPIRRRPDRLAGSQIRPNILTSPGITADRPFPPYRYLPVMFQDITTQDWVALLKGTIVSVLSNMSIDPKYGDTSVAGLSGKFDLMTPSGTHDEGHIYLGLGQDGVMMTAGVDSSYWGYEDSMAGLLVPCNGGIASDIPYTTDDVLAGTVTLSGTVITTTNVSAGYGLKLAANRPVGVTYQDVYQDIDGKWLNYDLNPKSNWGIVYDHAIEIPYIDNFQLLYGENSSSAWTIGCFVDDLILGATNNIYNSLRRKYAFLHSFYHAGSPVYKELVPGMILRSDKYGKFAPVHDCTDYSSNAFCQFVAKLIVTDCRYPKNRLDAVDTYPGSGMPGTETGGLPYHLFQFAYDVLVACIAAKGLSVTPTIKNVVDFVRGGTVGTAYINLQVA